jgi:hypothetical protein
LAEIVIRILAARTIRSAMGRWNYFSIATFAANDEETAAVEGEPWGA